MFWCGSRPMLQARAQGSEIIGIICKKNQRWIVEKWGERIACFLHSEICNFIFNRMDAIFRAVSQCRGTPNEFGLPFAWQTDTNSTQFNRKVCSLDVDSSSKLVIEVATIRRDLQECCNHTRCLTASFLSHFESHVYHDFCL